MWPFSKRAEPETEKRSSGAGYTAAIMAARESYISGASGVAELTATVQSCITLWEGALSLADVQGTDLLTRRTMALFARSLALRGEAVFLIRDTGLVPCSDWELSTRDGLPRAYRLSISEAGGGTTETALAAEVLHVRLGADPVAPWAGQAPLRRSALTAGMLQEVETTLREVYQNSPIASQIVPFPEATGTDLDAMGRDFSGKKGRVLMRESVQVSAAGGAAPSQDWKPQDVTPDLGKAMPREMLEAARGSVMGCFGVLPALFDKATTGPLVREAQRHLAGWMLQPVAALLAEEASDKLGSEVVIDVMRPVQAYDVGGRARALSTMIEGLARAKELGLSPDEVNKALTLVNWGEGDNAA